MEGQPGFITMWLFHRRNVLLEIQCACRKRAFFSKDDEDEMVTGRWWMIQNAKTGYHNNHAAEMLVSRPKKKLQNLSWWIFISAIYPSPLPSPLPFPTTFTSPTSSCLTLGFWLSPDQTPQYWTSHSIQTSFYHILLFLSCYFFSPLLFFSILLHLHSMHSLSAQVLEVIRVLFSVFDLKLSETLFPINAKNLKVQPTNT